jgi:hypothetical protein
MECFSKTITLQGLDGEWVVFRGERDVVSSNMILVMIARKLLMKGCMAYLTYALEV